MFARCAAENVFNFWFTGKTARSTALNVAVQVPYLLLAGWGAILLLRARKVSVLLPLALVVVYNVVVYAPILSQVRYSVPLVPFVSLLAAVAVSSILRMRRSNPVAAEI